MLSLSMAPLKVTVTIWGTRVGSMSPGTPAPAMREQKQSGSRHRLGSHSGGLTGKADTCEPWLQSGKQIQKVLKCQVSHD